MDPPTAAALLTRVAWEKVPTTQGFMEIGELGDDLQQEVCSNAARAPMVVLAKKYFKALEALSDLEKHVKANLDTVPVNTLKKKSASKKKDMAAAPPTPGPTAKPPDLNDLRLVPYTPLISSCVPPKETTWLPPGANPLGKPFSGFNRGLLYSYAQHPAGKALGYLIYVLLWVIWALPLILAYFFVLHTLGFIAMVCANPRMLMTTLWSFFDLAPTYFKWVFSEMASQFWDEAKARLPR